MKNRLFVHKITQTALLGSVALVLSALQMLLPDIPLPIPGAKPGFSNIVTAFACESIGLYPALYITLIKAIFAFITRGATAFFMSFIGGLLSCIIMYILLRFRWFELGYLGIGISGAVSHNMGQLFVAYLIIGKTIFYYIPFLLIISLITGSLTGITMGIIIPPLKKIKIEN